MKPPCVTERWGPKRGGSTFRSAAQAKPAGVVNVPTTCGGKEEPSPLEQGEGHGTHLCTWSGCGRTSRRIRAWNGKTVVLGTGETLLGPVTAETGVRRLISGSTVKWSIAERESEGVVVVTMAGTTQPGRSEGPLLHRCTTKESRNPDECRGFG